MCICVCVCASLCTYESKTQVMPLSARDPFPFPRISYNTTKCWLRCQSVYPVDLELISQHFSVIKQDGQYSHSRATAGDTNSISAHFCPPLRTYLEKALFITCDCWILLTVCMYLCACESTYAAYHIIHVTFYNNTKIGATLLQHLTSDKLSVYRTQNSPPCASVYTHTHTHT